MRVTISRHTFFIVEVKLFVFYRNLHSMEQLDCQAANLKKRVAYQIMWAALIIVFISE